MARANNKQLWACNPSVCAVTRPSAEEPAHLQPLEQPLHQALLRGLGAHLRPELRHVLHDRWGDTHKTAALPHLTCCSALAGLTPLGQKVLGLRCSSQTYIFLTKPPGF